MRYLPAITALACATVIVVPIAVRAQIIRDPARDSVRMPPPATRTTKTDSVLTPIDRARLDQRAFEAFRRLHLPHMGGLPSVPKECDEHVGRFCYWYDESHPMPEEPAEIRKERDRLLDTLAAVSRALPSNLWIFEQRVRYLAESNRLDDALALARACGPATGAGWRCDILVGFSHHLRGEYTAAERVFDAAIAEMPVRESCEWRDMSLLLDAAALGPYRSLKCDDPARDAWAARTWFLARTLYSMKGNDSRTEYFARMTMVQMLEDAPGAYQFGFDLDERELLLRFGWPRAWAAVWQLPFTLATTSTSPGGRGGGAGDPSGPAGAGPGSAKGRGRGGTPVGSLPPGTKVPPSVPPLVRPPDMPGTGGLPGGLGGPPDSRPTLPRVPGVEMRPREGDGVNVIGIEAFPAYRYIPAAFVLADATQSDSAAWRLHLAPVIGRYAPPYAKTLVPLEHQKAVFRRGDSALVVMAYETKGTKSVDGAHIRAALVVTPADSTLRDFAVVRDNAPATGVLTVRAPWGPLLMSAEVVAPERNAVARARYGVGPVRAPVARVALSDLLFYTPYASAPASVEDVAPHALHTERLREKEKLGVYWEAYGTDPAGEKIRVSLIVARETEEDSGGFLKRLGRSLRISGDRTPVSISIDDVSALGRSTSSRGIEFDISTLTKGAYIVQLEIEVAGQPALRAEHRIVVVGQ